MDKPICTLPGAESLTPHEQNKRLQAACRRLFSTEDGKIVLNMLLTDLKFFDGAVSEKDSVLNEEYLRPHECGYRRNTQVIRRFSMAGEAGSGAGAGTPAASAGGTDGESLAEIMTGTGTPPEGGAGNAGGGTSASAAASGGEVELAEWVQQLPEEMRSSPENTKRFAQYKSVEDMAKAYLDLDSRLASSLTVPGKDASAEEVSAFWEKAGRPKTSDGYSVVKTAGKDALPFGDMALKANLTDTQAAEVFNHLKTLGEQQIRETSTKQKAMLADTEAKLKAEYGAKFSEKIAFLKRGLGAAGQGAARALFDAGISGHPDVVRMMIAFGEMTSESGSVSGGQGSKPLSIMEGGTFEYKE